MGMNIDQDLVYMALIEICHRIEKCGASVELTSAVSLASDLSQAIGNKSNPPNIYALDRVKQELCIYPYTKEKHEDNLDKEARRNHRMIHGNDED